MPTRKFHKSKSLSKKANSARNSALRYRTTSAGKRTVRRRKSSTAGKILPPLDVRKPKHLKEFEKRIKKGPITIILVYADWCGHCHTMMPHFDAAAKSPNRSIQAVKVNETMLEKVNETVNKNINQSAKPLNVEGYPSIIVVDSKANKVTDLEPVRNTATMKSIMENAGPLAENVGLNMVNRNEKPIEVVNNIVKNEIINLSKNMKPTNLTLANVGVEDIGTVSLRKNINVGEDNLKGSIASEPTKVDNFKLEGLSKAANLANAGMNNKKPSREVAMEELKESIAPSPINIFSAPRANKNKNIIAAPSKELVKEAEEITSLAAPITPPSINSDISESISNNLTPEQKIGGGSYSKGGNGSLISALTTTTYKLAPTAALLATAAYVIKGKKHTRRRAQKRKQKTQKRK